MKSKRPFRFWRKLGVTVLVLAVLLALFFVAFVWNPFEGSLRDVRDVVPREVDFYLRKTDLRQDFAGRGGLRVEAGSLPRPAFWEQLTEASGWRDLQQGPLAQQVRGELPQLQQAVDALASLQQSTNGFLDVARDLVGTEVVVAGYTEDRSRTPPQPLQEPRWCVYARTSWRLRVAHGLLGWSMVQNSARGQGVEIVPDGDLLAIRTPQLRTPLYLGRRLDCLMLGNHKELLLQSERLADGSPDEQPFGMAAQYTEGLADPLERWSENPNNSDRPNALEVSLATIAFDGFRRFAAAWPDARNRDSMNERVLASFLNLKGWTSVTGSLVFEEGKLSTLGRIVLNSNLHTPFQSSFYKSEGTERSKWLDPFLQMVPDSACAAAALRVPPGEFLHAMYDALLQSEREMLDDSLRRCTFQGQQLADTRDLIEKLRLSLWPHMGFVFRKNTPDTSRNEKGELYIPVIAQSPVPQVAWVFWLRELPGRDRSPADDLVDMLRRYAAPVFRFTNVYHLPVDGLPEPVTEFANAQIPGTGEIAAIVFREFLVLSNSGPLIKDILRTRYNRGPTSIYADQQFQRIAGELPRSLNGFVWARGDRLLSVLDDYRNASVNQNREPDPVWVAEQRSAAEDVVRRMHYPQYPSISSIPRDLLDGEFNTKVREYLREQWTKASAGFSAQDLPAIDQMRGLARLIDAAYLQLELENNYIRFQGKVITGY